MLTVQVPAGVQRRYKRLVGDLRMAGVSTSMTEVVNALLHAGPATDEEVRALLREYRDACRDDL